MADTRRDRLVGVVVSLPTFNDESYNLLLDRQKTHVEWMIERGMTEGNAVLMIAAGLGEGNFMDDGEWRAMADVLVEAADGRVPTGIGLDELSARRAAKKAQYAADAGIDFIQLAPPRYMPPTEEDVFGHFKYVNDAADIGIMAYNLPWCIPGGYNFTQSLFERFAELENMDGIKWGSPQTGHWANMVSLFRDTFSFIEQGGILGVGARLGMSGFIDTLGNVAPRLSLKKWELMREGRFDELDLMQRDSLESAARAVRPGEADYPGMGEGPPARFRLRTLGMETGPYFPAQAPLTESYVRAAARAIEASGVKDWVDWDQSIFDGIEARAVAAAAS